MSTKIEKIYLDMDGVIADFEKRYKERYGIHPSEAESQKKFNGYFDDFIQTQQFATLDLMPNAHTLINTLENIFLEKGIPTEILSSTANIKRHDELSTQKSKWLKDHGILFKQNFVPGKELKYKFATPTSIIIDDTDVVISDWKKAGGIPIHHKDVETTLAMLIHHIDNA
jgi:hypothetical protein